MDDSQSHETDIDLGIDMQGDGWTIGNFTSFSKVILCCFNFHKAVPQVAQ